jgi:hypothetical protein
MVLQGRRCDPSGQAVRFFRAGGMVLQGRRYDPSGQAVPFFRAGGTDFQSRQYGPSVTTQIMPARFPLLLLSWAGGRGGQVLYGLRPLWSQTHICGILSLIILIQRSAYIGLTVYHCVYCWSDSWFLVLFSVPTFCVAVQCT